jgi:hypothetical protein
MMAVGGGETRRAKPTGFSQYQVGLAEKKLKLLRRKDSSRIKDRQNTGK